MPNSNYTAADALIYLREKLELDLNWIYDSLANLHGVTVIDGEEYLPEPVSEIMAALYSLVHEATETCVEVGSHRREDDVLRRPLTYSNGNPVFTDVVVNFHGMTLPILQLQHPTDVRPASNWGGTSRAGHLSTEGGHDCA